MYTKVPIKWQIALSFITGLTISALCYAPVFKRGEVPPEDSTQLALWMNSKVVLFDTDSMTEFMSAAGGVESDGAFSTMSGTTAISQSGVKQKKKKKSGSAGASAKVAIQQKTTKMRKSIFGSTDSKASAKHKIHLVPKPEIEETYDTQEDEKDARIIFVGAANAKDGQRLNAIEARKHEDINRSREVSYSAEDFGNPNFIQPIHFQYQMLDGDFFTVTAFNQLTNYHKISLDPELPKKFSIHGVHSFLKGDIPGHLKKIGIFTDDGRTLSVQLGQEADLIDSLRKKSRHILAEVPQEFKEDYGPTDRYLTPKEMTALVIFVDKDQGDPTSKTNKVLHSASYLFLNEENELERFDFPFLAEPMEKFTSEYMAVLDKSETIQLYATLGVCSGLLCNQPNFMVLTLDPGSKSCGERLIAPVAHISHAPEYPMKGMTAMSPETTLLSDMVISGEDIFNTSRGLTSEYLGYAAKQPAFKTLVQVITSRLHTKYLDDQRGVSRAIPDPAASGSSQRRMQAAPAQRLTLQNLQQFESGGYDHEKSNASPEGFQNTPDGGSASPMPAGLFSPPTGLVSPPTGLVSPPTGLVSPPTGLFSPVTGEHPLQEQPTNLSSFMEYAEPTDQAMPVTSAPAGILRKGVAFQDDMASRTARAAAAQAFRQSGNSEFFVTHQVPLGDVARELMKPMIEERMEEISALEEKQKEVEAAIANQKESHEKGEQKLKNLADALALQNKTVSSQSNDVSQLVSQMAGINRILKDLKVTGEDGEILFEEGSNQPAFVNQILKDSKSGACTIQ